MRNKRDRQSLDQEVSKTSPPNKRMSRGGFNQNQGAGSGSGPKQFTLNDVMMKLERIEGEIARVWQKLGEVDQLKREVTQLQRANESFLRHEIDQKRKCILIKGLASESTEKYEKREETRKTLDEMFNYLGLKPVLEDYQRLGELKKDESESTLIRVKFVTMDDKNELFSKFKDMGNDTELKKISLITDYPQFQLQEVKRLSNIAYDIRKGRKGTKTRIVPRGLGLALQSRIDNGKWTTVSTNPDRFRSDQTAEM
jgi:hypothetical protein